MEDRKRERSKFSKRFSKGFMLQVVVLGLMWCSFISGMGNLSLVEVIKKFDPYDILQVDTSADERDIKKAYRKLSLQYHPDKNLNDPMAAANFIQITKAYKSLTEENAIANYQKFGNPDGPSTMKVGIGLPRVIVEEKNQLFILSIFSIVLLFALPLGFIALHSRQKRFSSSGVLVDTIHFISYIMHADMTASAVPELLAASAESRDLALRDRTAEEGTLESEDLTELRGKVMESKTNIFKKPPVLARNRLLLCAHLQRKAGTDRLKPAQRDDLETILAAAPRITQQMIQIAITRDFAKATMSFIHARRCLIQALDCTTPDAPSDSVLSLTQVPHVSTALAKSIVSGGCADIQAFRNLESSDRKSRLQKLDSSFDDQKIADVEAFVAQLPQMEVTPSVSLEGIVLAKEGEEGEQIEAGDIPTIKIELNRANLKKKEAAGPVHCPVFPADHVSEVWWVMVTYKKNGHIMHYEQLRSAEKNLETKFTFRSQNAIKHVFCIYVMCESYLGFDIETELEFDVVEAKERVVPTAHPEDLRVQQMPTMIQQMMGMQAGDDDDEESDNEQTKEVRAKVQEEVDTSDSEIDSD